MRKLLSRKQAEHIARPLVGVLCAALRAKGYTPACCAAADARNAAIDLTRSHVPEASASYWRAWADGGEIATAFDHLWQQAQAETQA